jgi:hypothetical protein
MEPSNGKIVFGISNLKKSIMNRFKVLIAKFQSETLEEVLQASEAASFNRCAS